MSLQLTCCWCDNPIEVGIGAVPLVVCNDCFEALDLLDALLGRMPRRRGMAS
jgi:hypothetical protein